MAHPPPASPPLRIGTRRSNLAMIQARGIRDRLQELAPGRSFEIEALETAGDKDQAAALYSFGAKSLWTAELEEKLNSGELDVIVHCLKDMPTQLPESCELAAIPLRDDARDALVVKAGLPYTSLDTLPGGAVVGTSSVRRSAQLGRLYPQLRFANLRGNVETRLAKVDVPDGEYACMVMSAAGLERVGLKHRISQYLGSRDGGILHAVGQGALGLEIRKGDAETRQVVDRLGHRDSTLACLAERALLRALEGGCSVPIGVETEWVGEGPARVLRMASIVVSLDGTRCVQHVADAAVGTVDEATALGHEVAARLVSQGADVILGSIKATRAPR